MPTGGRSVSQLTPDQRRLLQAMETQWLHVVLTGTGHAGLDEARSAYEANHISVNASRKNNRHMLQALDRLLVAMGIRLDAFKPLSSLVPLEVSDLEYTAVVAGESRLLVKEPSGKKRLVLPRVEAGECKDYAPVIHFSLDQGGIGLPMTLYLLLKERLRMSVSFDLNHRIHNDVLLAATHSGFIDLRLEAKVAMRARAGPFQSGSFLHLMRGVAREYFAVHTYANALFQVVYEELADSGSESADDASWGTQEHMLSIWDRLKAEAEGMRLDAQPEQSRWFSWEVASRHFLPQRWLYVMLLTYLGMKRRWYTRLQDTPLYTRLGKLNAEAFEESVRTEDGMNALVDDDPEAAEAGDDADQADQAPSKSKTEALQKLAKRRKRLCTLAFVLQLLCDDRKVRLWCALSHITHPLEVWYRKQWHAQRDREQSSKHAVDMQTYEHGLEKVLGGLFDWLLKPELLRHLGVSPYGRTVSTEASKAADLKLLQSVLDFVVTLAGELCLSFLLQRSPPHSFLLLLSDDHKQEHLLRLSREWSALQRLERSRSEGDSDARSVLGVMLYPGMTWVRETFVRLRERDFLEISPCLHQQLNEFASSHMSTLVLENSFNDIRRVNNKTRSKNMSAQQVWHSAMSSRSCVDFGRPHVVTGASPAIDHSEFRRSVFENTSENVYTESALDEMVVSQPSWPTPSPPKIKLSAVMWHTMCMNNGEIDKMRDSWKNLLLSPGLLFLHESMPNQPYIVLSSHLEGVVAHRVKIDRVSAVVQLVSQPDAVRCFFASNPREYRVGVLGLRLLQESDASGNGAQLHFRRGGTLMGHACKHGFPSMSLSQLRALGRYLELEVGPRCTEEVLMRSLLKKLLDVDTDEAYADLMKARCGAATTTASVVHPVVLSDNADEGGDDWEDAEIIQHIQEHRKHERARQQQAMQLVTAVTEPPASAASASSVAAAASSSSSTTPVTVKPRLFNPLPESGITEDDARKLAPSSAQLYKDTRENRWRIKSPYIANKSHTKARSYGSNSGTENEAL
eukprot:1666962-Amphidinium_carterae.1